MENELLNQGLTLLLAGMGTVFVFLSVLVGAMTSMSWAVTRFQSSPESAAATEEEVAAISAAIVKHRNNQ
jgi:oxaloacetate decarboxylase gamma subunit